MNTHEEIYFISKVLSKAKQDGEVELNTDHEWKSLCLNPHTVISEDYLHTLNETGVLDYDEIGDEGFKPIIMCYVNQETTEYLKNLIIKCETEFESKKKEIEELNKRIADILTFDPNKLSKEIKTIESKILDVKAQLQTTPLLQPLTLQLDQIDLHFKSLSKVAHNYEDVYKNIILPVREEGKAGVKKTVQWAIISIILSTLFSLFASWLAK